MQQIRGVTGFFDGEPKLIYQNTGAEPEKLGLAILGELRQYDFGQNMDIFREYMFPNLLPAIEADQANGFHKQDFRRHLPAALVNENAQTVYDLFEPLQGT